MQQHRRRLLPKRRLQGSGGRRGHVGLLMPSDPRIREEPFLSAPYIHKNNEPKYHAMLLRAAEQAKRERKHVLWYAAVDCPLNPAEIVKTPAQLQQKLERVLQFHDQQS